MDLTVSEKIKFSQILQKLLGDFCTTFLKRLAESQFRF
jgi:hypothetical protein